MEEKETRHDIGDVYLWTGLDQSSKLVVTHLLGKRSANNARCFMTDLASRLHFPAPHESDDRDFHRHTHGTIVQISTDGFAAYPEAVDLAFGPYVRYGQIIKEYRNANMIYTPSEMVGTERRPIRGIETRSRYARPTLSGTTSRSARL
jgi:hypothetical protein